MSTILNEYRRRAPLKWDINVATNLMYDAQTRKRFHHHNATIYEWNGWLVLVSYSTPVVVLGGDRTLCMITDKWYSRTTTRQISRFLNEFAQ